MKFLIFLFVLSVGLGVLALWIYCLIDILRAQFRTDTERIVWLLLILLAPVIGIVLYLAMGQNQKIDHPQSGEL